MLTCACNYKKGITCALLFFCDRQHLLIVKISVKVAMMAERIPKMMFIVLSDDRPRGCKRCVENEMCSLDVNTDNFLLNFIIAA